MKKIIVFLVFLIFALGIYFVKDSFDKNFENFYFKDDFDSMNRDFWYAGEWKTLFSAYDKVEINNGKLKLEIKEVDRGPFLLSEPIEVKNGDILTIKRKVRMSYANENFTGGLALFETKDEGLIPSALNSSLTVFGNGVVLVEYVHNYDEKSVRPGSNVFRVLSRGWEVNGNYKLCKPTFGEWFEEELVYNTVTEQIIYRINGEEYYIGSQKMENDKIRVFMHGYGFGIGHTVEMDWIEISVERTKQ